MTMKPFDIQEATLKIGGVQLEAGNTGVVIPGVTQATSYKVEDVSDTSDQTNPLTNEIVIDAVTYNAKLADANADVTGYATYQVELDDENFIDNIEVTNQGSYTDQEATTNEDNDMWAYSGTDTDGFFADFVPGDWFQVPFRPKMRAGEVESINGGADLGNLRIDTWGYPGDEPVRLTHQTYGESILIQSTDGENNGRSSLRWHSRPEPDGNGSQYSQVDVQNDGVWIKNADWTGNGGQHYWQFDNSGNLKFPDGSIQTTAYTGQASGSSGSLPTFLTELSGTNHLPTKDTDYGWDTNGVWFTNATIGNGDELTSYPVRTAAAISSAVKTQVSVNFVVNDLGADFGIAFFENASAEWEWGSNSTRLAAQYNGPVPEIYDAGTLASNSNDVLTAGNTYRAVFTYDPTAGGLNPGEALLTFETYDLSSTLLDSVTLTTTAFTQDYWVGFAADQDNGGTRTYMSDLAIDIDNGATSYFDSLSLVSSGSGAELVGDGYVAGSGVKRIAYTSFNGYQGGESTSLYIKPSDAVGISVGDTLTFRNGEVRTISTLNDNDNYFYVEWSGGAVEGGELDPRYPVTLTSQDYVAETKKTARVKPDLDTEGSGQYMDVYVGGSMVVDNKHVHMAGHSADTELFLGTDNNFVSTKEAGLSPARVNLKSENDITVSDTNLRMSRSNTWVSVYGDGENRNTHNNTYDLTWNVIDGDNQGNFYVGGESCAYAEAMVAKYGPDGDLLWTKLLNGDALPGWDVGGVVYNPDSNEVAVAVKTDNSRDFNYYKLNILDGENGDFKSSYDIYDPDGYIDISQLAWHPTLGYVAVGRTHGEQQSTSPIAATGATGTGIIELPVDSVKIGGQWPDRNGGSWSISGTGITGNQVFQNGGPGLYQNLPVINLTNPTDTGLTVSIRIDYAGSYYDYFTTNTSGTGVWAWDDDFKILGSLLGGVDGGTVGTFNQVANNGGTSYFSQSSYPTLNTDVTAGTTARYENLAEGTVTSVADAGDGNWAVNITMNQGQSMAVGNVIFYTGNDITGKIADLNGLQIPIIGTPNIYGNYRIDMGYQMGYGSTDFTGGTFTISASADDRAFVWTNDWVRVYNPENVTSTSNAFSVDVHKMSGDIVVGGVDNYNGKGFVWKLNNSGDTEWVKGLNNDDTPVRSVAVSAVTGDVYYTTTYNSVNKLSSSGALVARVSPNGPWGHDDPILKLEQGLDGVEYVYVAGRFGAMWTNNPGYLVSKLNSSLEHIWSRDIWNYNRDFRVHYNDFHNNIVLGRDKVVMAGYTYISSFNNALGFLASIGTGDTFDTVQLGDWHVENPGGFISYDNVTADFDSYDFIAGTSTTDTGSMLVETDTSEQEWTKWSWKSSIIKLDKVKGLVGVEGIQFADGGMLDHNPSDIPPVLTDFDVGNGYNYTLQLSDRGKFITNGQGVENYINDLYITVPTNSNVMFPVGSVITLINVSNVNNNGYRIYVQPENYSSSDCPRIYATDGSSNWSTWSFQGIQTATLMKIGSNEWLLTANNISNED